MSVPLFVSSGDLRADRRYDLARQYAAAGDPAAAADLLAQAVELAPAFASAWFALGEARGRLGEREGAIAAFRAAIAADPDDRHGAGLHLARLGGGTAAMPETYVRTLFDQYAPRFDAALTGGLGYRGPQLLRDAVTAVCRESGRAPRFDRALDLGCGTGLAGEAFRHIVDSMIGVDLSPGMVEEARRKGCYNRLAIGDMLRFLADETDGAAGLAIAADALVYVPDLLPAARELVRVLEEGGLFAFTVETHDGDGVVVGETLRYAHSPAHVRDALEEAGLALRHLSRQSTRTEAGAAVPGLVVVAARR